MSSVKLTQVTKSRCIIEAIDALRNRKARPDETRICHWIERRYGLKKDEIIKSIADAVADGSVLRVKYKDSISYRNPAKFTRFVHSNVSKFSAPLNVTKRILRVLRQLTRTEASLSEGASISSILKELHRNKQLLNYNEAHLDRIMKRVAASGKVRKMSLRVSMLCSAVFFLCLLSLPSLRGASSPFLSGCSFCAPRPSLFVNQHHACPV